MKRKFHVRFLGGGRQQCFLLPDQQTAPGRLCRICPVLGPLLSYGVLRRIGK